MHIALVYLIHRAFFRVGSFFSHWYVDGSRTLLHWFLSTLEQLDRRIALRVTFRHFFEPLYQDYSAVGRILGIVFRSFRVVVGVVLYVCITAYFAILAVAWYAIPAALLFYAITGF